MKTILDEMVEMKAAAARPDTWTDERRALKADIAERRDRLCAAKEHAPLLLAIVRDLAYGKGVTVADKITNARKLLRDTGMATYAEREHFTVGEISDGIRFYPEGR